MDLLYLILVISSYTTIIVSLSLAQDLKPTTKSGPNQDKIYFSDNEDANRNVQLNSYKDKYNTNLRNPLRDMQGLYPGVNPYAQYPNTALDQVQPVQPLTLQMQPQYIQQDNKFIANNLTIQDDFNRNSHTEQQSAHMLSNSSRALTNFGINLLKNLNENGRNTVISPYSVACVLAVLQQGALGMTQQQITAALQMLPDTSAEAFRFYSEDIQKRNSRNILRVGNNVYVADSFELNPAFKRVAIRYFGSEVTPMRFSRPVDAVQKINNWIAMKTNNKIENLLSPDAISEDAQLVLVNAVYFKGLWQVKFKPESTLPRSFYLSNRSTKITPFMRLRKTFKTGMDRSNNAQVIILPFENEQYSLMIVLPSEVSSLNALMSTITADQLASYHQLSPKEVDLEIPKFTIRGDTELNQVLKKMGVSNLFGDKSELSGVGTYRTISPQVSSALHSALLSIDEQGSTAAAATAFVVVALSYDDPALEFKANRPFLAVLWDHQLSLPLFMAKIEEPVL